VSGDADKAKEFYGKLFGWETEVFSTGGVDYPMITAGGQQHGGFGPAQGGAPPHWFGHVLVDDVDAAADRAKGAGGTVLAGPMDIPDIGRFAILQDPQGAVFSVFGSSSQAVLPEGVFVWDELVTTDIEAAKRFYGEVVGWSSSEMEMPGGPGSYTIFSSGEQQAAGGMPRPPQMDAPPHWMIYVGSNDVDAHTKKAKELGAQVYMEPFDVPTVGRLSVVADPTGAVFGIFQGEPS
jgi:predicted enzyme related to lactoylglutathione lyase